MKLALLRLGNVVGWLLALPFVVWARFGLTLLGSENPYSGAAYALALIPGYPGMFVRRGFYCSVLPCCRWDVDIRFGSVVTHPSASIGRRVYVGAYTLLGRCRIGDDAVIGSRVSVLSGRHPHRFERSDLPIHAQHGSYEETSIGADCWLGEGSIVMADLGRGVVVGAGAVVVKPIAEMTIVAGNPARPIGRRGGAVDPAGGSENDDSSRIGSRLANR